MAYYDVRQAKNAQGEPIDAWYFVLVADNGEIVSTSELYTTKAHAERGAEDANRVAAEAEEPPDQAA